MSSPATAVTSSRSFSSRPRRRAPGSTRIGSGRSSPRSRSRTASPSLHPSASRASRTTKRPTRRTFSAPPTRHSTPRSVLGRTRSPRRARRRESHDMAQRDILIVDDDRQVREVLHQIFVAAGYNCLLANDGREYHKNLERRVVEATRDLASKHSQLQETYRATLEALGSALDTRDVGTESHSRRVHGYALATADEYGVPEAELPDLAHGVL